MTSLMEGEKCDYLMIMESPPAEVGYWPNGIPEAAPGNGHMQEAQEKKWLGDVTRLRQEHQALIARLARSGVPLIVVPYPKEDVFKENGLTQDIEFLRDPSLTRPDGTMLLLNMGAPTRRNEPELNKVFFDALGVPTQTMPKGYHEGGNTRFFKLDGKTWYISGTSTRSDAEGLQVVTEFLTEKDPTIRHECFDLVDGLHLDCVFTHLVTQDGVKFFAWMDAFTAPSRRKMEKLAKDLSAPLYPITKADADALTPNQVQWGDEVFASGKYTSKQVQQEAETGVTRHTLDLSQNRFLGGAAHCLTREVTTQAPIDPKRATAHLQNSGLFQYDARLRVFNNY